MKIEDTSRYAYNSFRDGFQSGCEPCPPWDEAPDWVRDLVKVSILTGALRSKDVLPYRQPENAKEG